MSQKIVMYYHGGSKNHGCEAIVRATAKIFGERMKTYAMYPDEDRIYGLHNVVDLKYDKEEPVCRGSVPYFFSALVQKICKSSMLFTYFRWKSFFSQIDKGSVYLSTGGDNYCYPGVEKLADYNAIIRQKGGKTVLWGCSVEPERIVGATIRDLQRYDLITARESLTVEALKKAGITKNVVLFPDPAFQLDPEQIPLPAGFVENNMVGINLSPLIISCEHENGITRANYVKLIQYILKHSDMGVALIPHVVKDSLNDFSVLEELYSQFSDNDRVVLVKDHNCQQLKWLISKCRFFIGARTHATIAAYSTGVPTLVVGYSIKALGIAKDIFGTHENYVLPVQSLCTEDDLANSFRWLQSGETAIRDHLQKFIPSYCSRATEAAQCVRDRLL